MAIVCGGPRRGGSAVVESRQSVKPRTGLSKTQRRRRNKWLRAQGMFGAASEPVVLPVCDPPPTASECESDGSCVDPDACLTSLPCEPESPTSPPCEPESPLCESAFATDDVDAGRDHGDVADTSGDSTGFEYHALRDYSHHKAKRGKVVEKIEVEWNGGVRTWERRDQFETPSCADHVRALVQWYVAGRSKPFRAFRRSGVARRVVYTAGESGLCGFAAVKIAFALLGWPKWASDELVAAYIAEGVVRGKNYRAGVTWEQLLGFIGYLDRSLGEAPVHPCTRVVAKDLRHAGGNGRAGVDKLTPHVGVYLVGLCRVGVAHFVTVEVRDHHGGKFVHDESGCFALAENEWMDGSQLVRVHRVGLV